MCAPLRVKYNISFAISKSLKVLLCHLQDGESWKPNNCTTETCQDGRVITEHVRCKPVTMPVCENGYPPVTVYDEAGCCFHYDCRCKLTLDNLKNVSSILKLLQI